MITLCVKVTPRAHASDIVGWEEEVLKVRLKALPEKGNANKELIKFLSKRLKIPQAAIEIVHGHTGRLKRLEIEGLTKDQLIERCEHP